MTKESDENKKSSSSDDHTDKQESRNSKFKNREDDEIAELTQEKLLLNKINKNFQKKLKTTNYLIIVLAVIVLLSFFAGSYFFSNIDESEKFHLSNRLRSNFVIQNLKGDVVDTWISWNIEQGDIFHVHLINSKYVTQERQDAINEVLLSSEQIEIDDSLLHKGPAGKSSTYYLGWKGALNSISKPTKYAIPTNIHSHLADNKEGDILIELTNLSNSDGYSGLTSAIVDDSEHQILKSTITIYNIESISIEQLKTIVRHELGHGFGLAHSSALEDLMAPQITTPYPYISECDLDAITFLYDGGKSSKVICEK